MILIIDNYDSFTYNLVQYVGHFTSDIQVHRNDALTVDNIRQLAPQRIIISPGPGKPIDAGVSVDIVKQLGRSIPILGICLGHQSIAVAYGATVVIAPEIVHGKTCTVEHDASPLYKDIDGPFVATRYHSLIVDEASLPETPLRITARTPEGMIMGLRHEHYQVHGLQFHPESILTEHGMTIIDNFLNGDLDYGN